MPSPFPLTAAALRRPAALGTLAAACLLAAGCASPGPAHRPLAATSPAALGLVNAASAPAAPQWWTALGDAQLNALVEQALQGSPSLAVGRARLARAQALAEATGTAAQPHALLEADASRQRYSANGLVPPPIAGNTWTSANLQAGLNWSPDFFGQHAAELAAAVGQARAAQADAAAAANALAAQVSRSYVALARLLAQRAVAERNLAQRSAMLQLTNERTQAGLDSQVELTQAQVALPDVRTQIEALDEQITLARRQLAVLCGQAPDAQAQLAPQLQHLALSDVPELLGADLLGRRPDVVAARWRVEAAAQDVAVARTQFYPDINLSAFIGLNALGLNHLFNAGSRQIGVAPALRLPLFDGTRLRAQLGGRQAELDAAIAQYNGALLDAVQEAGDAIASVQSLARQQALQGEASAKSETAYDFAVQRYRAGLGNYLLVLNTESQLLAQRRLAVDLRARQLDTRVVLMKALGGGWSDDTGSLETAAR
ncbi:RND transporter [Acidovorax sp. SRB_14]|uniref:efflux transporter outer membrane subunit n=1 Tax=Acidovorax sp. SRB_14 TaxID=1962699 RepID=UPI0015669978|nr:efflux transporter outer membrane subunit [Acidovorax sp. SRB_14]NMM79528.1 RND transporter [Acidovorax sp. SRB_14]